MSDLRTFQVEIETDDADAEYDLMSALEYLAETVTGRVTVKEGRHVIFLSAELRGIQRWIPQ